MPLRLWRITYHYPEQYENQRSIRCTRSKSKPPKKKTFVGVVSVDVEEIPQTEYQLSLYELIVDTAKVYNSVCDDTLFKEEEKTLKEMLIKLITQARETGMNINAYMYLQTHKYIHIEEKLTEEQMKIGSIE